MVISQKANKKTNKRKLVILQSMGIAVIKSKETPAPVDILVGI